MYSPLDAVLISIGVIMFSLLCSAFLLFLHAYFIGGGLETDGESLRKKWSKTERMKKFLGVAEYDKNKAK